VTRWETAAYTVFRVVFGALFTFHGIEHVIGAFGKAHAPVGSQFWIGGLIELVCGPLVALGLLARPAAFLACGEMAVAYFQFHWKLAMGAKLLPIVNGGELAVLYCFGFLLVLARGAGPVSLDRALRGNV
jgi:putative oxidoreductase